MDVAAIMRGLNLPYVAGTRVDGKLDAEWPGLDYIEASGAATASLTPLADTRDAEDAATWAGTCRPAAGAGTIVAEWQQLTAAGAELTGRLRIGEGRRLEGQLHGTAPTSREPPRDRGNISRPSARVAAAGGGHRARHTSRRDSVERSRKPIASVNVSAPSLSTGAANEIEIGADLTVTPEAVTITRAETKWNGAHAALNGTVGLTGSQPLDLVLDADARDLQHVVRGAGPWGTDGLGPSQRPRHNPRHSCETACQPHACKATTSRRLVNGSDR